MTTDEPTVLLITFGQAPGSVAAPGRATAWTRAEPGCGCAPCT